MLFAAPLLLFSSCGIEDVEAEDGAIVFELYDTEGNLIEGLQSMRFGTTATYTLKSAFVTYTVATPPTGWKCTVIPSSRSCSVTAPPASDLGAKASGDVVIEIQSQAGRTETYTLAVAALENDITLTFDEETTSKTHVFSYGKSMEFEFTSENTASLDVSVPKGWTYTADVDAGLLTVTAPTQEEADPAMEGSVKVTPLSVRGTAGEGSSIPVELSTKLPIISFAEADYKFAFGEQRDIPCTVTNVATCDITALKGWDIALDIKNSVLKVTAPADGADCTGAGTVEFAAVSAEELTASFSVRLSWKGISTPEEFVAFGNAVTEGAPLDAYTNGGRIVLVSDIDLSALTQTSFAGSAANPFKGTFDGLNNTITVKLADQDSKELGLFHTLDATAEIKNLSLAGSMSVSQATPVVAGTLAVYNNGAALTKVTNKATLSFSGAKTVTTAGYLGGLVGLANVGSVYTDCHNTGEFIVTGTARTEFIGGIVAGTADKTEGSLVNCTNKGNFSFDFPGAVDTGKYGGLFGHAEKSNWTFSNCTNEGTFTVTFADPGHQFHSLGGILATGYGVFDNCVNKGKITFNNSNGTKYRRTGGIVGCVGSDAGLGYTLRMTNCRNEADIAASTASVGGLIGIAEKVASPALIENCINTGNMTSPTMADYDLFYMGGIAGKVAGAFTLKNCINRGNLTAAVERDIAGIAVSGDDNAVFDGCENYGNITVVANHKTDKWRPIVAGIDAQFFNQRLTFTLDVFKEHRYDILTSLSADDKVGFPYIVGQVAPIVNSGIVDNHGVEFEIGWNGHIGQHFRYYIRPNFTFARNKIKYCNEISYIDNNGRDCPWRYQTGKRLDENFCYIFDHFVADQGEADRLNAMNGGSGFAIWGPVQPGDVVYKDLNGDGVVNNYDRAAIGNPRTPEIQFGIPLGLSYKGFDFSMLWQGSALCSVQLSGPAVWDFPLYDQSRIGKVRRMHLDRWTPETAATAKYPALHYGIHNNNKQQYSSLFLYDASYIRLKNVEIGYTLPKAWTSKAGIQNVRIYVQGQNLLTFDNLGDVDMDPEIKNGDGSWFPVQRVINIGLNMTF